MGTACLAIGEDIVWRKTAEYRTLQKTHDMPTVLLCTEFLGAAEIMFWRKVSDELKLRQGTLVVGMPETTTTIPDLTVLPAARRLATLAESSSSVSILSDKDFHEALEWSALWELPYAEPDLRAIMAGIEVQLMLARPGLILVWNGLRPVNFLVCKLAGALGIPFRIVERTPWPLLLSLDEGGSLLATGAYRSSLKQAEEIAEDGSLAAIGHAYYEDLKKQNSTWWEQPESQDLSALRQRLGIKEGQEVLLFAGQIDTDTQQFLFSPHFKSNIEAFSAFCRSIPDNGKYVIFGKHHPKSKTPMHEYRSVLGNKGFWIDDVSLNDAFALADRVVAVNSAVIFESMAEGKPTMALGDSMMKGHNTVVEWASGADAEATGSWLDMSPEEAQRRKDRFVKLTGYFIRKDFYSMLEGDRRGVAGFSSDCLDIADHSSPDWNRLSVSLSDLANSVDDALAIRRSRLATAVLRLGRNAGKLKAVLRRQLKGVK